MIPAPTFDPLLYITAHGHRPAGYGIWYLSPTPQDLHDTSILRVVGTLSIAKQKAATAFVRHTRIYILP